MVKPHFVVKNGILKAGADLRREYLDEFCDASRALLAEPVNEVVIDLTRVDFIFSSFVGVLGNLSQDCHNINKMLVILVPEKLAWVLDIDKNLNAYMRIEKAKDK